MTDHRIRLTDEDLELIVAALVCRMAMTRRLRRHRVQRLAQRLQAVAPGNPKLRYSELEQTHENDMDEDDA